MASGSQICIGIAAQIVVDVCISLKTVIDQTNTDGCHFATVHPGIPGKNGVDAPGIAFRVGIGHSGRHPFKCIGWQIVGFSTDGHVQAGMENPVVTTNLVDESFDLRSAVVPRQLPLVVAGKLDVASNPSPIFTS